MRAFAVVATILMVAAGCGSRCAEIAARKQRLLARTAIAPGPHLVITIPMRRANAWFSDLVRQQPLREPIPAPELGPISIAIPPLVANVREITLRAGAPDHVRFAIELDITQPDVVTPITSLAVEVDVVPKLVRHGASTDLSAAFGPANLLAAKPTLGNDAKRAIADAVLRWLPAGLRDRAPRALVEAAADRFADHLIGAAYRALQTGLLRRLGEVTELRIKLPEVPIANVALTSDTTTEQLAIALTTDLPVRTGILPATGTAAPDDEISVRMSLSTAAEIANWAIDHGRLPQHYTRDLEPRAHGEYRPWLDVVTADRRPIKVHVFQERGGCAYFEVGFRLGIELAGGKLVVSTLDRYVETASASRPLEIALWLKQLVQGAVDRSKAIVDHVELAVGAYRFTTRIVKARVAADELIFQLVAAPAPASTARLQPLGRRRL